MMSEAGQDIAAADREGSLLALGLLSLIAGAGTGLVGALFLLALKRADDGRNALIAWAHGQRVGGLLVTAVIAGAIALAAWLVRRFSPAATGSGIHQVEAVLKGES
jgi:chloride channel protein, CIC family